MITVNLQQCFIPLHLGPVCWRNLEWSMDVVFYIYCASLPATSIVWVLYVYRCKILGNHRIRNILGPIGTKWLKYIRIMRTCATAHGRAFLKIPTCAAAAPATQVDAFNLASFTVQSEPRRGLSNSFWHCTCEGLAFSILHNVTYFPGKLLMIETFVHSITIDGWDVQQIQSSTIEYNRNN